MGDRHTGMGREDVVSDEVGGELRAHNLFKDFRERWEDGYGAVVARLVGVTGFVDWCDDGNFPCVREGKGGYG